jgi:hypothetical protein
MPLLALRLVLSRITKSVVVRDVRRNDDAGYSRVGRSITVSFAGFFGFEGRTILEGMHFSTVSTKAFTFASFFFFVRQRATTICERRRGGIGRG